MPVQVSNGKHYPLAPAEGELPKPSPVAAEADPLATGRDPAGRIRTTAAAQALARRPRRRQMLPPSLPCDERFEPFNLQRRQYLRERTAEYMDFFGAVSHGVAAQLNAAAWAYAAGEYASALAAEKGDVELFKTAANLTTSARGTERMAWEMAKLEALARTNKNKSDDSWLRGDTAASSEERDA